MEIIKEEWKVQYKGVADTDWVYWYTGPEAHARREANSLWLNPTVMKVRLIRLRSEVITQKDKK